MSNINITKQKSRVVADITGDEKIVNSAYILADAAATATSKWETDKALLRNRIAQMPELSTVDSVIMHGSDFRAIEITKSLRRKSLSDSDVTVAEVLKTKFNCPPIVKTTLQLTITGDLAKKVLAFLNNDLSSEDLKIKTVAELSPSFEIDAKPIIESGDLDSKKLLNALKQRGIFAAAVEAKLLK